MSNITGTFTLSTVGVLVDGGSVMSSSKRVTDFSSLIEAKLFADSLAGRGYEWNEIKDSNGVTCAWVTDMDDNYESMRIDVTS